jgi:type VI secretion system protein ImpC
MPTFTTADRADVVLATSAEESARPRVEGIRRYLVLGDFSGRESREVCEPETLGSARRPVPADVDDFEGLMSRLAVEIRLYLTELMPTFFRPRSLEDFHPDRMLEREPAFKDLKALREGLGDPERYAECVRTIAGWGWSSSVAAAPPPPPPPPPKRPEAAPPPPDLLEKMLESHRRTVDVPRAPVDRDFDNFVQEVVRPHVAAVPRDQGQWMARADAAIGNWMRSILHDPLFQSVEAAWRGLDFLLRRVESGPELRVEILDVTREELARDLKRPGDLTDSGLRRVLAAEGDEDGPNVVVGLYSFAPTVEDIALLARLGKVAGDVGATFVSAAGPSLLGATAFDRPPDSRTWKSAADEPAERLWAAFRQMPQARSVGLAAPRFLLRLPYGVRTDPTERFAFEEMEEGPVHKDYLWGSPALLCLVALEAPGAIAGLPIHVSEVEGETRAQPCAETLLPSSTIEAMLERGIMPVVALKDRDEIRLARLQSVADPASALGGPRR